MPLSHVCQPAPEQPAIPAEIEILIGQVTAAAVGGLAAAVQEFKNGGAESGTKLAAGDGIARLILLKQAVTGEIVDFEATARTQALQLLRAHCGDHVSTTLLAGLIDDVLRLVHKVTRTQIH
jgi:hypothetical protein